MCAARILSCPARASARLWRRRLQTTLAQHQTEPSSTSAIARGRPPGRPRRPPHFRIRVLRTDNEPRVRDGYISLGTRGHARARQARRESPICRKNVIASARPCPPVPPVNLHGKEGVSGSSPEEGFYKRPANRDIVACSARSRSFAGLDRIRVFSDSALVVNTVNGDCNLQPEHLKDLCAKAGLLVKEFADIQLSWVPRGMNLEADALASRALGRGR
jgi:hypothetical protein